MNGWCIQFGYLINSKLVFSLFLNMIQFLFYPLQIIIQNISSFIQIFGTIESCNQEYKVTPSLTPILILCDYIQPLMYCSPLISSHHDGLIFPVDYGSNVICMKLCVTLFNFFTRSMPVDPYMNHLLLHYMHILPCVCLLP